MLVVSLSGFLLPWYLTKFARRLEESLLKINEANKGEER